MRVDNVGPEILVIVVLRELIPGVQLRNEEGGQILSELVPDVGVVDVGGLTKNGRALPRVATRKLLRLRRVTTGGVYFVDFFSLGADLVRGPPLQGWPHLLPTASSRGLVATSGLVAILVATIFAATWVHGGERKPLLPFLLVIRRHIVALIVAVVRRTMEPEVLLRQKVVLMPPLIFLDILPRTPGGVFYRPRRPGCGVVVSWRRHGKHCPYLEKF